MEGLGGRLARLKSYKQRDTGNFVLHRLRCAPFSKRILQENSLADGGRRISRRGDGLVRIGVSEEKEGEERRHLALRSEETRQ